jgi:transposase-like protein
MTFLAVRWPHCDSAQIVKRGKTHRGTPRYLCQNTRVLRRVFCLTTATEAVCPR